jgi:predicted transcriptional regulator
MAAPGESQVRVEHVMHAGLITCRSDASLRTVAGILAAHRIHAVVVSSGDEKVACAVVTDRDVVSAHARGELDRVTAREAANEPTVTVRADAELRYAADLMAPYGTSHLIVTARGGRTPVGVLSSLDVAGAISRAVAGTEAAERDAPGS